VLLTTLLLFDHMAHDKALVRTARIKAGILLLLFSPLILAWSSWGYWFTLLAFSVVLVKVAEL